MSLPICASEIIRAGSGRSSNPLIPITKPKENGCANTEKRYTSSMEEATRLYADFQIKIAGDEIWRPSDLEFLRASITILSNAMGGKEVLKQQLGEVLVERTDTGKHLGLAYRGRIQLSRSTPFSAWSVIHELSHAWDAKHHWMLSVLLEKYTGGFTSRLLSRIKKWIPGQWDAGRHGAEQIPGRYGRKPGVNAFGYFYGDKPSGSNWQFNRKEDFAESLVMYCGWGQNNLLSRIAHGRIERYTLPNGERDPLYRIADQWSDYARYFYPPEGDYTQTKRWKFFDELIQGRIQT